ATTHSAFASVTPSDIVGISVLHLDTLAGAFAVARILVKIAKAITSGNKLFPQVVRAKIGCIQVEREGDLPHDLDLLLDVLSPEKANEMALRNWLASTSP